MADQKFASGWVWSGNVRPLIEMVSDTIGYAFDDSDWLAISDALPDTDDEEDDGWYVYPLMGGPPVELRLAQAVGGGEVSVQLIGSTNEELRGKVELLLSSPATWSLCRIRQPWQIRLRIGLFI